MAQSEPLKPDQFEKNLAVLPQPTHRDDVDDDDENDCLVESNETGKLVKRKFKLSRHATRIG